MKIAMGVRNLWSLYGHLQFYIIFFFFVVVVRRHRWSQEPATSIIYCIITIILCLTIQYTQSHRVHTPQIVIE